MRDGGPSRSPVAHLREFWLGRADLAPLALFRVLFGLLLANWFWQLWPDLTAFFTDEGLLPRRAALTHYADRFSLLHLFGEWWQVALFTVAAVIVSLLLAVGYRTRLMAVLAFVAVLSFQNRDPLILDGSDLVFRMTAFWLIFTAAGGMWSLDALIRRARGENGPHTGPALPIRVLQVQIAWIYLATGLEKLLGQRWLNGTATWYALQLEHTFGRAHAAPLLAIPGFVRTSTVGTLLTELLFLPLAFFPVLQPWPRVVAVISAAGLHLGILTLMNVGNFPVVMLASLVLFLPARWVERAVRAFPLTPRISAYATAVAVRIAGDPAPRSSSSRPRGTMPAWIVPARGLASHGTLVALAVAAMSSATPRIVGEPPKDQLFTPTIRYTGLEQRWDMFSPEPANADGWISARGVLADGTHVELIGDNGRPLPRAPIVVAPGAPVQPRYADPLFSRWVKVYERIPDVAYTEFRLEFGRMFCRIRNHQLPPRGAPLVRFDVTYTERVIQRPGGGPPVIRTHEIWSHTC